MAMPTLQNSRKAPKKKLPAKKQWKAAPSKPSATSAIKAKPLKSKEKSKFAPVQKTIDLLASHYPNAHCALTHDNPFQLLVATILSAQCTDERVNQVTPVLFAHYPTVQSLAEASPKDVEAIVRSTGFYVNKAKNLINASKTLVELHNGEIPRLLEDLVKLPGVGRKTANVVLGNAYQITSGIVVDTHVSRLSNRLGWVKTENPEIIERELQKIIPEDKWIILSHWLITHGRQICKARKPLCEKCFLFDLCPKRGV